MEYFYSQIVLTFWMHLVQNFIKHLSRLALCVDDINRDQVTYQFIKYLRKKMRIQWGIVSAQGSLMF